VKNIGNEIQDNLDLMKMGHLWDIWDMNFIIMEKGQDGDNGDIFRQQKEISSNAS